MTRRPGYREAVEWLAYNDDNEWAHHPEATGLGGISVAGALVRDLYGVEDARLRKDIVKLEAKRDLDRATAKGYVRQEYTNEYGRPAARFTTE
jgi:hypothetical protein